MKTLRQYLKKVKACYKMASLDKSEIYDLAEKSGNTLVLHLLGSMVVTLVAFIAIFVSAYFAYEEFTYRRTTPLQWQMVYALGQEIWLPAFVGVLLWRLHF